MYSICRKKYNCLPFVISLQSTSCDYLFSIAAYKKIWGNLIIKKLRTRVYNHNSEFSTLNLGFLNHLFKFSTIVIRYTWLGDKIMRKKLHAGLLGTYRAIKFLVKMSQDNKGPDAIKSHVTLQNNKKIPIDFYPSIHNPTKAPTIMFVHGINKGGNNEPRIINLCRSITNCGFNVVAPYYEDVAHYWIAPDTAENIAQTIDAICKDQALAPTGDLGIFSISFTGTLSIHAASKCSKPRNIRDILLMGSFSRAKPTLEFILSKDCQQIYPKLILIRNLLRIRGATEQEILDGLLYAINATFINDDHYTELKEYLTTLAPEKQQQIWGIINNAMDSEHYIAEYTAEINKFADLFDKSGDFSRLTCPVVIVHGYDDNTIPYVESEALHEQLNNENIVNKLLVTNLIENHSHYKINLETIKEFIKLAVTIGVFFNKSIK
jgi:pimeloyl-ACP methyl ester carboxylesterase